VRTNNFSIWNVNFMVWTFVRSISVWWLTATCCWNDFWSQMMLHEFSLSTIHDFGTILPLSSPFASSIFLTWSNVTIRGVTHHVICRSRNQKSIVRVSIHEKLWNTFLQSVALLFKVSRLVSKILTVFQSRFVQKAKRLRGTCSLPLQVIWE
jgi:hypothetical protein